MSRRRILQLLGGSALSSACGPALGVSPATRAVSPPSDAAPGVRAVAFDLFTLFDPRGVEQRVTALVGDSAGFAATWKTRLFEYCWIRAAAGKYADFEQLVRDSLAFAAQTHHVTLTESVAAELAGVFSELQAWPDTQPVLAELRARGLKLAPLANFTPRMIEGLLRQAGLRDHFDALISTDQARTYKPDPRAYALGEATFGLSRRQIAFAAFGGWDAAGARWFGYQTFWVNRLGVAAEQLTLPDASGADLKALAAWLASGSQRS